MNLSFPLFPSPAPSLCCCLPALFAFVVFNFIHILLKCITLGFSGYKLNASTANSRRGYFSREEWRGGGGGECAGKYVVK